MPEYDERNRIEERRTIDDRNRTYDDRNRIHATTMDEKSVLGVETAGFVIEAAAGIAIIVLAIIGLARGDAALMTAVGAIVLGGALLAQGAAISTEYANVREMNMRRNNDSVRIGGGVTVEILGGAAAVVLGILGLLGFRPDILLPVAMIVGGATLVLAADGIERLNVIKARVTNVSELGQEIAKGLATSAVAAQVLAGGAAVVLGILALVMSAHAGLFVLVALLVLGAAATFNGTAFTGRFMQLFKAM